MWLGWEEVTPVLKGKREGAGGELLGPWCGSGALRAGSDPGRSWAPASFPPGPSSDPRCAQPSALGPSLILCVLGLDSPWSLAGPFIPFCESEPAPP